MKKIVALFSVVFCILSCEPEPQSTFTSEALAQPLLSAQGQKTTVGDVLAKHKGKTVVIDIWAAWCGDCIKSLPKVTKVQKQFPEVQFLFFSVDDKESMWKNGILRHMDRFEVQGEQYFFGTGWPKDGSNAFIEFVELDWIPRYMVVDKNGNIATFYAKSINDARVLNAIKEAQ